MAETLRFLPAGSNALLVELCDLEAAIALYDNMQVSRPPGVVEIVPAARTVLIRYDRLLTERAELVRFIEGIDLSLRAIRQGRLVEVPVMYDGEDLGEVARLLGWSRQELIESHTSATFTVAFTGFAPGFAYMACDNSAFDVPRRSSPRIRIPAGAVALGGKFCGIYPSEGPGGWQLIGRTPLTMWDVTRSPAALLAPGDRVRFKVADKATVELQATPSMSQGEAVSPNSGSLVVTRADRAALYQDLGRLGLASQGLSESGALDRKAIVEANLCVGNGRNAAAVEIAYGGFAVKASQSVTLALTGAPTPATIATQSGRRLDAPMGRPFALDVGDELTLEFPSEGTRTYLAMRGGFNVAKILNSAATDTLAKVGPNPIQVGDSLSIEGEAISSVNPFRSAPQVLPKAGDVVDLDIILGPRTDWFTESGISTLFGQEWLVTQDSSRVGIRLTGARPLERAVVDELPSEGTPTGAIQVPRDGQPILFLADHPITGGYPVVGVVADHHLDLASQVPIGAKLRFKVIAPFDSHSTETKR